MSNYSKGYYVLSQNSKNKQPYHWVLKASNHEVVLTSETYVSKHGALNGIDSVRNNCEEDSNYERKTASDGSPYFNLRAKNYEVIGTSEMYSSLQAMENGIKAVKKYGVSTVLVTKTASNDTQSTSDNDIDLDEEPVVTEKPQKSEQAGRYA